MDGYNSRRVGSPHRLYSFGLLRLQGAQAVYRTQTTNPVDKPYPANSANPSCRDSHTSSTSSSLKERYFFYYSVSGERLMDMGVYKAEGFVVTMFAVVSLRKGPSGLYWRWIHLKDEMNPKRLSDPNTKSDWRVLEIHSIPYINPKSLI